MMSYYGEQKNHVSKNLHTPDYLFDDQFIRTLHNLIIDVNLIRFQVPSLKNL